LQQYGAAGTLAQVHGDTNINAEASYWLSGYTKPWGQGYARLEILFPTPGELTNCMPLGPPFARI
jgi:hypothetical protein